MADVRDYGAVGDGATDDTDAIQHAVDERAGLLVFPPGSYRITRPVVWRLGDAGPCAVQGEAARLLMDGAGPALDFRGTHAGSSDPESVASAVRDRERMPRVAGLEIAGLRDDADGIRLEGTMQPTISGVLIQGCRYGVHLVGRNRNLLLADCHIYHGRPGGIGVYLDGVNLHQANIAGCHISFCPHAGVKVERSEVRNLQISGCDIEYNHDPDAPDSADVWIDARAGTVREGAITGCTIQARNSPGGSNIRIEGPPDPAHSRGAGLWTITGNILQSQEVNLRLSWCRGVVATGNSFASGYHRSAVLRNCRQVVLAASTIDYNPDYEGDRIDGVVVEGCHGVTLDGLLVQDCRAGAAARGAAIELRDGSAISLSGCQVLDPWHRGIEANGVLNLTINGCTIADRHAPARMREAVHLADDVQAVVLAGCLIGRGTEAALRAPERADIRADFIPFA